MPTQLEVYNDALRKLGELRLATLTDDVEARYVLDGAWPAAVELSVCDGYWNFATKTVELVSDSAIDEIPGYASGFNKPADWLRTIKIYPDANKVEELDYADEGGKIYANQGSLILRYLSRDPAQNLSTWPVYFTQVVAARLALEVCDRITQSGSHFEKLYKLHKELLASARNKDALDQPSVRFRPGSWVRAMRKSRSGRANETVRGVTVNSVDGGMIR